MPALSGNVKDLVDASMASNVVELVFRLNTPNVQATGSSAGTIHPTADYSVIPTASGSFSFNPVRTDTMLSDAWLELGIVWQGSKAASWDYPQWQIRVDSAGPINEKIFLRPPNGGWGSPLANLSLVLVALTRPDNLQVGQLWLQAAPESHNSPDPALNTGKLYRGI